MSNLVFDHKDSMEEIQVIVCDIFKLQHEREKKDALATFDAYKCQAETRETQLKSECEAKVNQALRKAIEAEKECKAALAQKDKEIEAAASGVKKLENDVWDAR